MPVYEASALSTITTATNLTPLFGFKAGGQLATLREIHLFNRTAPTTVGAIGLFRSSSDGTGAATSSAAQARKSAGTASSTAIVWTTYATTRPGIGAATTQLRAFSHGTAVGNGIVWTFDMLDPIEVGTTAATAHLVFANISGGSAAATYDFCFVWEE